jgi:hypothetical protein
MSLLVYDAVMFNCVVSGYKRLRGFRVDLIYKDEVRILKNILRETGAGWHSPHRTIRSR